MIPHLWHQQRCLPVSLLSLSVISYMHRHTTRGDVKWVFMCETGIGLSSRTVRMRIVTLRPAHPLLATSRGAAVLPEGRAGIV
jgi:hypothetical protein